MIVVPPASVPLACNVRPTSDSSRSATIASALPLFDAGNSVLLTLSVSPLFGTPLSCNSKPLSAIGWPGVQVPVPLVPSLRVQL